MSSNDSETQIPASQLITNVSNSTNLQKNHYSVTCSSTISWVDFCNMCIYGHLGTFNPGSNWPDPYVPAYLQFQVFENTLW